jgi:hypothetical protein
MVLDDIIVCRGPSGWPLEAPVIGNRETDSPDGRPAMPDFYTSQSLGCVSLYIP